jgi:inner membrane protein
MQSKEGQLQMMNLPTPVSSIRINSRSLGVKLIIVSGLALLMLIPAIFIDNLIGDRSQREADVIKQISDHVGGPQTLLGPTLAIPYIIAPQYPTGNTQHGVYLVFPSTATATVQVATQERHISLFKVPVFKADSKLAASFDLSRVPDEMPQGASLEWSQAEIVVGVSDPRGMLADVTATANGETSSFVPAKIAQSLFTGTGQNSHLTLTLYSVAAGELAHTDAKFNIACELHFSGAQHITLLAYGKTTNLKMQGDWPSPGFDGGFLPVTQLVTHKGFAAEWSVPFLARGVRAEGPSESITGLDATALGVSFIEVANPYQSVNRALKYLLLFLGLVFLTYFIFEVTSGKRVHPAQYVLVGVAQLIFYLLLLSLSERIGFDLGFLLAGTATVLLLSTNAVWIFGGWRHGARAFGIFTFLYLLIYSLLRLEDNSLLIGAIASFVAVACAMYFTRKIDWYGPSPETAISETRTT